MGADGGYYLYKFSELNQPQVLRRIQNWFICSEFELDEETGNWQTLEYGPWVNGVGYTNNTILTVDSWLKKNGFNHAEDIPLQFILKRQGCSTNILKAGEIPGLQEDLVRVSYGDNVPDNIRDLNTVIIDGRAWWYAKKPPAFFEDIDCCYPEGFQHPWSFCDETWT